MGRRGNKNACVRSGNGIIGGNCFKKWDVLAEIFYRSSVSSCGVVAIQELSNAHKRNDRLFELLSFVPVPVVEMFQPCGNGKETMLRGEINKGKFYPLWRC